MWLMEEKATLVSAVQQCMARNSPVRVCKIKQIPKREPKFHHDEIIDEAGKSIN